MKQRRVFLILGGLGLAVSAACPAEAGTSAEVDGGVYGGTASGAWACGPTAKVNYGGLGARGRVWLNTPEKAPEIGRKAPEGFSIGAGVAGEQRSYKLLDCHGTSSSAEPCEPKNTVVPGDRLMFGAQASLGYDSDFIGGRFGALAFQRHKSNDAGPTLRPWPELQLRIGRRNGLRGEIGSGSYSVDTIQRPALLFLGITWPVTPSVELSARAGSHFIFDEYSATRVDLSAGFRVGESARVGLGAGVSQGVNRLDPHGRLTIGAEF